MGFYPDPHGSIPCLEQAQKLLAIIRKHRKLIRPPSMALWGQEMMKLCRQHGQEKVNRVLDWYEGNLGRDFVPTATSATMFASKFSMILKCMETSDELPSEKISPVVQAQATVLLNDYKYPIEIAAHLPVILQRTKSNWIAFLELTTKAAGGLPDREKGFLRHIWDGSGLPFPTDWMILLSQKYGYLEHYTYGSPLLLAFKPESQLFRDSFWRCWSQQWSGAALTFDGLLEALLKEKKDDT